ncbi:uncharacterized protein At2g39920-like [Hibiscus syriacus]|uniref:uncharacterized protein At2g39920-like n=1 Tax=Hibiscus syriacus TaxID=106335 RepID=UPI001920C497|nr:uncharacterized protein At2g39920-like [Hibiscus syriacus]XP_039035995.1 uncharacterized protein At2g39920-like [Hibiscus syriacus]XP_039035998.1 uncharacterized protein At2g39920-like [Hibiscus syriacus]
MSAYGHQMEREFSGQSLLSSGDSGTEIGSRYNIESGFYMTSYAATIFIAGLLVTGVLLVTMVVSLAVMLQSCESRSKGMVKIEKERDSHRYCQILTLHGELNGFKPDEVPPFCRSLAIRHIKAGGYARDLDFAMRMIDSFFDSILPLNNSVDAVLMDIDDILVLDPQSNKPSCGIEGAMYLKQRRTLKLYMKLHSRGWSLILLSRKPERQRNFTIENLNSIGYRNWSSLIMRSNQETETNTSEYFSRRRKALKEEGKEIISVISSQMDALTCWSLGIRVFKLPKVPQFDNHLENCRFSR